jgi:hypothetical protein
MTRHLEKLARRVEDDPFFLASALKLYAKSEDLDETMLADVLGCAKESLPLLGLCRAPAEEPAQFQKDIDRIVERFQVHPDVLAEAVRRGQTIVRMRRSTAKDKGTLLAARDGEKDRDTKAEEQGGEL